MTLMKHSKLDLFMVAITLGHVSSIFAMAIFFDQMTWPWIAASAVIHIVGINYAYQACGHNFLHNEFFKNARLNVAYSYLQTVSLLMSTMAYKAQHLNHHKYNYSPEDYGSIYRRGKDGQPENMWRYAFLEMFRTEPAQYFQDAKRFGKYNQALGEKRFLKISFLILLVINYKFFLLFFIPVSYLGIVSSILQGYSEHAFAKSNSDAIEATNSCYNPIYNFVYFNNGYHAEHHYRAAAHWSKMKDVRAMMEKNHPELRPRIVSGCHLFGLFQKGSEAQVTPASSEVTRAS